MTAKWKQIDSYMNSKTIQERTQFNVSRKQAQMMLDLKKDELRKMRFLAVLDYDRDDVRKLSRKDRSIIKVMGRDGGSFRTALLRKRANEEVDLDESIIPATYHIRVDGTVDSRSARQVEKDLKRKGIRDAEVQVSFKGNDYLQVFTSRTEKDVKKGLMDIGVEVNEDEVKEDAPTNAVAHGGVDMNPTGLPKKKKKLYDGRTKEYKLHRRNLEAQREKRLKKLKAQKDTLCGSFRENLDIYTVKEDNVAILKKIVKDKRNMPVKLKDGQMKVDLYTASAIVQVYDNMKKPDLKKKLEFIINKGNKAKFLRLVNVVFK